MNDRDLFITPVAPREPVRYLEYDALSGRHLDANEEGHLNYLRWCRAEHHHAQWCWKLRQVDLRLRQLDQGSMSCHARYGRNTLVARHQPKGKILASFLAQFDKAPSFDLLAVIRDTAFPFYSVKPMDKWHPVLRRLKQVEQAFSSHEWRVPEWFSRYDTLPSRHPMHFLHTSTVDPTQVAYYRTVEHFMAGRETRTKPGRYLQQYFADVLTGTQIKALAEEHAGSSKPAELAYLRNDDEKWRGNASALGDMWVRLYDEVLVDYSCMRGSDSVRVYGLPGNHMGLAYLETPSGVKHARAIVTFSPDGSPKEYVRAYPFTGEEVPHQICEADMRVKLEQAGFVYNHQALHGLKVRAIHDYDDYWVMPYLDGSMSIRDDSDPECGYFVLSRHGSVDCQDTGGTIELGSGTCCDECGDPTREEDLTDVSNQGDGPLVCEYCLGRRYTAVMDRHGDTSHWVRDTHLGRNGEVETGDGWFVDERAARAHGWEYCEYNEAWYPADDLVDTARGLVRFVDAVELDHTHQDAEGEFEYAYPGDEHTLSDGTVCHEDDADELQAQIDEGATTGEHKGNPNEVAERNHELPLAA